MISFVDLVNPYDSFNIRNFLVENDPYIKGGYNIAARWKSEKNDVTIFELDLPGIDKKDVAIEKDNYNKKLKIKWKDGEGNEKVEYTHDIPNTIVKSTMLNGLLKIIFSPKENRITKIDVE